MRPYTLRVGMNVGYTAVRPYRVRVARLHPHRICPTDVFEPNDGVDVVRHDHERIENHLGPDCRCAPPFFGGDLP
ncbi:MAG: hypothetical protein ACREXU_05485 [Gammaproteobacteria bacterium]